jgi:hypothetical protein
MRRLLLALFAVLSLAALAPAAAPGAGLVSIKCTHVRFAQVDPVLKSSPMTPPDPTAISGHLHDFGCNDSVNSNSTVDSLMQAQSSARVGSDINGLWTPAVIGADGSPVPFDTIEYRLGNQSPTPSDVHVPPNGLTMVGGAAADRTSSAFSSSYNWQCIRVNVPGLPNASSPLMGTIPTPEQCPAQATEIRMVVYGSLGCWDGVHLGPGLQRGDGPADGRSHATSYGTSDCPAPGVKLPFVSLNIHYPPSAAGGHLSCDNGAPGACMHWDFVALHGKNAAGQDFWTEVVDKCLNNPTYYITCLSTTDGRLVGDHGVGTVLQAGPNVPPVVDPPASAVPLLGFDHTTVAVHYYSLTPVSPNPPWAPIASPARVEAPPCDAGEKPLDFLSRYSTYTWTDDADERATLISQGFAPGGTKACTVAAGTPASVPLYRVTKTDGDRVLTASAVERDQLVAAGGTSKTLGSVYPPT